jgi:hypothetical protein
VHTIIVIGGGASFLGACLLLGHAFAGLPGLVWGARLFIPAWFVLAGVNMWIGVSRAGYAVADETPVFLGIFASLAIVAGFIAWKWS